MRLRTITVIGVVDPVDVVGELRRLFGIAEIILVGPAKEEEEKKKKDEEEKKKKEKEAEEKKKKESEAPRYKFTVGYLNSITNNFSEERIIGRGRHGVVYKVLSMIYPGSA